MVPTAHRIRSFSGITGTSDPASLRRELETRLMDPGSVAALSGLPSGTALTLKVDANGHILSVSFDRAFPGSAKVELLMKSWHLRNWTGHMAGFIEMTLG